MGIIVKDTTEVTTAVLTQDTIKALIAADMGVPVETITMQFRLVANDYDGPGCPTYRFDKLEVKSVPVPLP